MPSFMTSSTGHRVARIVGMGTAAIGAALLVAPGSAGPLMRLTDPPGARIVGALDLALVPGLLAGSPRWPWMSARAVLNLAIAAYCLRLARESGRVGQARAVGAALAVATIVDATAAAMLRDA